MSSLSRMTCSIHGDEQLHRYGVCVACKPEAPPTKPQPKVERKQKRGRYGNVGRPAALDLTDAELKVARLLATGITQAETARKLGLTRASVSMSARRGAQRIGAFSTSQLIAYVRGEA